MQSIIRGSVIVLGALVCLPTAWGADANAGHTFFREQCALCHSAQPGDNGGAQGPNLDGLIGRRAAASSVFGYTQALRDCGLTWNAATLDRFLTSPTTVVPGTAMVIAVPSKTDRDNLVAYFEALKAGTFKAAAPRRFGPPPGMRLPAPVKPTGTPDWKRDFPGRVHRIDLAKLPAPYATRPAFNFPKLVPKPANARLRLPRGFEVGVFTRSVQAPRSMKLAPNGDIFVSETQMGRIIVLRPSADGTRAATVQTFAQGLDLPFGMAFYPSGPHPRWLYVAETNRERDLLGDDLVPDYSTRVRAGAFYGWPWYYMGNHQDPRFKGQRPDLYGKVRLPDVPYQSHSASLSLIFYTAARGRSAFPRQYVGDGFAVFHGSWDRSLRTGHKVVRVRMRNGAPTGEYDDFLVGFIADNSDAWGRPVGIVELPDGSLLLSDDGANVIYRISYSR